MPRSLLRGIGVEAARPKNEKRTMNMWILPAATAVILIILDQGTKLLALESLKPLGNVTLLPGVLDFTFVENRGVAFGMLSGQRWIILVLMGAIIGALVYYYKRLPEGKGWRWVRCALVLVLSGAVGNLIDRIFRGYVVDFFEFTFVKWYVFNVADIYVVLGVAWLLFLMFFVIKDEPDTEREKGD